MTKLNESPMENDAAKLAELNAKAAEQAENMAAMKKMGLALARKNGISDEDLVKMGMLDASEVKAVEPVVIATPVTSTPEPVTPVVDDSTLAAGTVVNFDLTSGTHSISTPGSLDPILEPTISTPEPVITTPESTDEDTEELIEKTVTELEAEVATTRNTYLSKFADHKKYNSIKNNLARLFGMGKKDKIGEDELGNKVSAAGMAKHYYDQARINLNEKRYNEKKVELEAKGETPEKIEQALADLNADFILEAHKELNEMNKKRAEAMGTKTAEFFNNAWNNVSGATKEGLLSKGLALYKKMGDWGPGKTIYGDKPENADELKQQAADLKVQAFAETDETTKSDLLEKAKKLEEEAKGKVIYQYKLGQSVRNAGMIVGGAAAFGHASALTASLVGIKVARSVVVGFGGAMWMYKANQAYANKLEELQAERVEAQIKAENGKGKVDILAFEESIKKIEAKERIAKLKNRTLNILAGAAMIEASMAAGSGHIGSFDTHLGFNTDKLLDDKLGGMFGGGENIPSGPSMIDNGVHTTDSISKPQVGAVQDTLRPKIVDGKPFTSNLDEQAIAPKNFEYANGTHTTDSIQQPHAGVIHDSTAAPKDTLLTKIKKIFSPNKADSANTNATDTIGNKSVIDKAAVATTEAPEKTEAPATEFKTVEVKVSSMGALQTIKDLKHTLAEQFKGVDAKDIPTNVKHILDTDHVTLTKEFGLYDPKAVNESAMVLSGSTLEFKDGNVVLHNLGKGDTILSSMKAEDVEKYHGKMFHYAPKVAVDTKVKADVLDKTSAPKVKVANDAPVDPTKPGYAVKSKVVVEKIERNNNPLIEESKLKITPEEAKIAAGNNVPKEAPAAETTAPKPSATPEADNAKANTEKPQEVANNRPKVRADGIYKGTLLSDEDVNAIKNIRGDSYVPQETGGSTPDMNKILNDVYPTGTRAPINTNPHTGPRTTGLPRSTDGSTPSNGNGNSEPTNTNTENHNENTNQNTNTNTAGQSTEAPEQTPEQIAHVVEIQKQNFNEGVDAIFGEGSGDKHQYGIFTKEWNEMKNIPMDELLSKTKFLHPDWNENIKQLQHIVTMSGVDYSIKPEDGGGFLTCEKVLEKLEMAGKTPGESMVKMWLNMKYE